MKKFVVIRGYGAISPLGHDAHSIEHSYRSVRTNFQLLEDCPVAPLSPLAISLIHQVSQESPLYRGLDRSVLMAIYAARQAATTAGWSGDRSIGVNIGSSRGATALFEQYVTMFNETGSVAVSTSPVTTLGNVSSWVGQDLNARGAVISHSTTCSTGIQAIANGMAWLKSGMADRFLAGASEAPLTAFTLSQMKALGIYSGLASSRLPCRPFNSDKKNTFVLGEGAAIFALEQVSEDDLKSNEIPLVLVDSVGFGFERIGSKTGISRDGCHFQRAMLNALENASEKSAVDLVLLHAPGTIAGDLAEIHAIRTVFSPSQMPVLCAPKWMNGHTLGASSCLALHHAIHILKTQSYPCFPYDSLIQTTPLRRVDKILINAAGFGGNAASMIVRRFEPKKSS